MRRLVGGLVLLNLATISLGLSAGEQSITDPDVLKQLEDLRIFIDENRDFSKQSSKGLKPVLVQYRSNESKFDGIVSCNLSFNTDALHLSIGGTSKLADGSDFSILINVVYEWTEYVGYTIKTATLTCSNTKVKVDDVKNIDGAIIDQLKCGDVVIKEDASGEHAYIVTFKSETGICLTYADASVVETQSYDLVDDEWVYNSEDKSTLPVNVQDASFKPIYWHTIKFQRGGSPEQPSVSRLFGYMIILNNDATPLTIQKWYQLLATSGFKGVVINGFASATPGENLENMKIATRIENVTATSAQVYALNPNNAETLEITGMGIGAGWVTFEDLGANKIN